MSELFTFVPSTFFSRSFHQVFADNINIHRRLHAYKLGAYFFVNKNIKSVKFVGDKCLMIEELVSLWLKSGVPETTTGVLAV